MQHTTQARLLLRLCASTPRQHEEPYSTAQHSTTHVLPLDGTTPCALTLTRKAKKPCGSTALCTLHDSPSAGHKLTQSAPPTHSHPYPDAHCASVLATTNHVCCPLPRHAVGPSHHKSIFPGRQIGLRTKATSPGCPVQIYCNSQQQPASRLAQSVHTVETAQTNTHTLLPDPCSSMVRKGPGMHKRLKDSCQGLALLDATALQALHSTDRQCPVTMLYINKQARRHTHKVVCTLC